MAKSVKFRLISKSSASQAGYSLVEIIVVVIILGILASVSIRSLRSSDEVVRTARTRASLDQIAYAIGGNPELVSGGARTDFGYVGDIGSLPPNLAALITNPGSYATWRGPYLKDQFTISGSPTALLNDAWGKAYSYSGSPLVQSTGSGSTISRLLANSTDDLLYNQLILTVLDLDLHPPGAIYMDSVLIELTIPDGSGSTTARSINPARDGSVQLDSIPIGRHLLRVISLPGPDTLNRLVAIEPGSANHLQITFPADLW